MRASGQKFIENTKNGQFGEFLKNWSLLVKHVTRQVNFNRTKIGENDKIQMRHLGLFLNNVQALEYCRQTVLQEHSVVNKTKIA